MDVIKVYTDFSGGGYNTDKKYLVFIIAEPETIDQIYNEMNPPRKKGTRLVNDLKFMEKFEKLKKIYETDKISINACIWEYNLPKINENNVLSDTYSKFLWTLKYNDNKNKIEIIMEKESEKIKEYMEYHGKNYFGSELFNVIREGDKIFDKKDKKGLVIADIIAAIYKKNSEKQKFQEIIDKLKIKEERTFYRDGIYGIKNICTGETTSATAIAKTWGFKNDEKTISR